LIKGQIYLIGSLRNPLITDLGNALRKEGFSIFDDWMAAGEHADDSWRDYEKGKGHSYKEALAGKAAQHVFEFDKRNLDESEAAVLVMPAGKSAHLELGYMAGKGKRTFYYMEEEPDRYDVMLQFCDYICFGYNDLLECLKQSKSVDNTIATTIARILQRSEKSLVLEPKEIDRNNYFGTSD
jgi:nucleoside 2-deoxyribosyltransferase